jgi:hypothetical protein
MVKIGERFTPDPNFKKLYYVYLALVAVPLLIIVLAITLAVYIYRPTYVLTVTVAFLFAIFAIISFIAYWIPKYYSSISYMLTKEEVISERGVWWRFKHVVPYSRVMSVDTVQGPISRRFGIGTVDVHTAGYTGPAGGMAGPGQRRAEVTIKGVSNFVEVKDMILGLVRQKPLFTTLQAEELDVGSEVLNELKKIRKILEKSTKTQKGAR